MALVRYCVSALANSNPLNHLNSALCTKKGICRSHVVSETDQKSSPGNFIYHHGLENSLKKIGALIGLNRASIKLLLDYELEISIS